LIFYHKTTVTASICANFQKEDYPIVIDFSAFNPKEPPVLVLRNMSGKAMCMLANAVDVGIDIKYNEVSTLTFTIAAFVNGEPTECYDKIIGYRLVDLRGIGLFVLMNPETTGDGILEKKKCTCYSLEHEFVSKQIFMENGTFNFWNRATCC